jgi:hypothetical protein
MVMMMVTIHTMADGKKAYYIQLHLTMTLLDILHSQLASFETDQKSRAHLSQVQTERFRRILLLFPIHTDESIGMLISIISFLP